MFNSVIIVITEKTIRRRQNDISKLLSYFTKHTCERLWQKNWQHIIYLVGVHERTELSMKHLSAVIRMLVRWMLLIEARTSAVSLGF